MKRLLLAELNRLRSRRLTLVAGILVVLVLAGLQLLVFQTVRPLSEAERADVQSRFQQAQQQYQQNGQQSDQECEDSEAPEDCGPPQLEQFLPRDPVPFSELAPTLVTIVVVVTSLASLMVAASLVGADYSSGSLANWLTFFPRRGQVFAAKLLAVVLTAAASGALALTLTLAVGTLITRLVSASGGDLTPVVGTAGRGVVVMVIFAGLGFALALLARHTIAAPGAVLGYLLVSFVLSILAFGVPGLEKLTPWQPETNLAAFLSHGYTYTTFVPAPGDPNGEGQQVQHVVSFAHGAAYWAVLLTALVAVAYGVFRRRDVN